MAVERERGRGEARQGKARQGKTQERKAPESERENVETDRSEPPVPSLSHSLDAARLHTLLRLLEIMPRFSLSCILVS